MRKKTLKEAVVAAYEECLEAQGMRQIVDVPPHRVVAYAVGTNLLRIDVRFAIRRAGWDASLLEADANRAPTVEVDADALDTLQRKEEIA